jgi:hypothetical protein
MMNQIFYIFLRYDLVDITKEVLRYKFNENYILLLNAYNQKDIYAFGYVLAVFTLMRNYINYLITKTGMLPK